MSPIPQDFIAPRTVPTGTIRSYYGRLAVHLDPDATDAYRALTGGKTTLTPRTYALLRRLGCDIELSVEPTGSPVVSTDTPPSGIDNNPV